MVFVPFFSEHKIKKLERRKGGGGGGKGGGGGGRAGGEGGAGSGSGSGGGRGSTIEAGGGAKSASSAGRGGGPITSIPAGQPFAGRSQGGGTRDQVFGSRQYGSGYPGNPGRGVAGRGFPFYFWPLAWGGVAGLGSAAYLHSHEYGSVDNSTRPGGPLSTATFPSSSSTNSTFRLLSDNSTVTSLVADIVASCGSSISSASSIKPSPYNDSGPPVPEQAVQYYRASSVALTLDGYNNTAVFNQDPNTPDVPLPSNLDTFLLNCLNTTIGTAVPLVDGAYGMRWSAPSNLGLLVLVWVISKLTTEA